MRPILAAALCLALPAHAATPDPDETAPVLQAAADAIAGGYAAFSDAADAFEDKSVALCDSPSETALSDARDAFAEAVDAWSRIELVKFGPVLSDNAADRIFFYPDRRGIGLRQVQAALASEDVTVTDEGSLAGKSVALQGLGTAEYLLHGTDAETLATAAGAFRCDFTRAVAGAVATQAQTLETAWTDPDGIAGRFADPAPEHRDFRSQDESLRALLGVFTNGVELLRDQRIKPFVEAEDPAEPRLAAWWRSGLTARAIAENAEGLRTLFEESGMNRLNAETYGILWDEIAFELGNLTSILARARDPETDPETLQGDAAAAYVISRSLRNTFAGRMAPALGQTAAFSVLDGD
ncbi:imelysin family protein [Palleronia sp.]|uniref:imelysin family protein n=1 Tax=Palleronia sp. TaxID=1940284 RepID=UPI0035C7D812